MTERLSERRALLLLTLLALAVRAAFLLLEPSTQPIADERTWTNWAIENLLTPKVRYSPFRTHMIFYPPLYPYFIALPYDLFSSLEAVKWAQVVVSALLVPALGRIAGALFGVRAGLVAAALTALYPDFVWFSVHFWCETLFLSFLWWAFERLIAADAERRTGAALAAGLLFGLSILTRETALYFTPLAGLFLARDRSRGGVARGAAFVVAALLVVAPWTFRNWVVFHAFVPVGTAGSLALYQGNAPLTRQEVYDRYYAVEGRIEQHRFAREEGLKAVLARQPLWIFEKLRDEMPRFWEADSLALIHVKRGAYGDVSAGAARATWLVVVLPYVALLAGFVLALARLRPDARSWLLLGFLAFYNLLHVATHGFARYRLPIMPVVLMLAAAAFAEWRTASRTALTPRRRALALALGIVVALSVAPSFGQNYRHPAFGFAPPGAVEPEAPPVP